MSRSWPLKAGLALLVVVVVVAQLVLNRQHVDNQDVISVAPSCHLNNAVCTYNLDGTEVKFFNDGDIRPLKKFKLILQANELNIQSANVSLSMPGMVMAENRFTFKAAGVDNWYSEIIIPVCTTGRRDWTAEISIKASDKIYKLQLILEV